MKYKLYTVPQATEDAIRVSALISVAQKIKTTAGVAGGNDVRPATELFYNCTLAGNPNEYNVIRMGVVVGVLVKGSKVDYVYYEGSSAKANAKIVHYMVYGNAEYDLLCINPSFETTRDGEQVVIVDTTTINGVLYNTAPACRQVRRKGRHFSITDKDANVTTLTFLGGSGYNQNGSSPAAVDVSKTLDTTDYKWSMADQEDIDDETLNLQFVYDIKNESHVLRTTLKQIFADV